MHGQPDGNLTRQRLSSPTSLSNSVATHCQLDVVPQLTNAQTGDKQPEPTPSRCTIMVKEHLINGVRSGYYLRRTNQQIARAHYNTPLCATHSTDLQLTCRRQTSRHFPSNARTRHAARSATHEHPQRLHSSPYHTNYPDDNISTATTDAHPHLLPMPHCNHCPHEPRRVSSNQRLTSKSVRGRCLETHHVLVSPPV